ncbi:accessory gene regulator ArgB-like protein [Alkaliphilus metalliredigens]|nr:accessory gene regulator B family protein [Alkaliphilus metalliredigens]
MINKLATYTVNKMNETITIDKEKIDFYIYGTELFIITLIKGIGLILIASILGLLTEALIFILAFSILRIQAGGIHANSFWKCFLLTDMITFTAIYLVYLIPSNSMLTFQAFFSFFSILLVLYYAPVESPNKPLTSHEKRIYKDRSCFIVLIGIVITLTISWISPYHSMYGLIFSLGFFCEGITLVPAFQRRLYKLKIRKWRCLD